MNCSVNGAADSHQDPPVAEQVLELQPEEAELPVDEHPSAFASISSPESDEFTSTSYWDAEDMAPLNADSVAVHLGTAAAAQSILTRSKAAVERLRAYRPPLVKVWDTLPVSRRAAVLILLYADKKGDLRMVITMRAASLRSFSGHAAFPGGKADTLEESPYQIARREAWEEIGLPCDDTKLPSSFRIEHLCDLPLNLARTELVVRPCVALLHTSTSSNSPTAEDTLIPRLDAREVAAVFSAPLHNFLLKEDERLPGRDESRPLPAGKWYDGRWMDYHGDPWRVHYFHVPVHEQRIARPRQRDGGLAAISEHGAEEAAAAEAAKKAEEDAAKENGGRFQVWGMTARIAIDTARVAFGREPEFEHNTHFGDEKIIDDLDKKGRFTEKVSKM